MTATKQAPPWIHEFKASVSWGDKIQHCITKRSAINYATVKDDDVECAYVPARLDDLLDAFDRAHSVSAETGLQTTLMFLDMQATPASIEQALFEAAERGYGMDCLQPGPRVLLHALLARLSEGVITDEAIRRLNN